MKKYLFILSLFVIPSMTSLVFAENNLDLASEQQSTLIEKEAPFATSLQDHDKTSYDFFEQSKHIKEQALEREKTVYMQKQQDAVNTSNMSDHERSMYYLQNRNFRAVQAEQNYQYNQLRLKQKNHGLPVSQPYNSPIPSKETIRFAPSFTFP